VVVTTSRNPRDRDRSRRRSAPFRSSGRHMRSRVQRQHAVHSPRCVIRKSLSGISANRCLTPSWRSRHARHHARIAAHRHRHAVITTPSLPRAPQPARVRHLSRALRSILRSGHALLRLNATRDRARAVALLAVAIERAASATRLRARTPLPVAFMSDVPGSGHSRYRVCTVLARRAHTGIASGASRRRAEQLRAKRQAVRV